MSWFRWPKPAPPPPALSTMDLRTISAYPDLTPERWAALSNPERAWYRENYTKQGVGVPTPSGKDA